MYPQYVIIINSMEVRRSVKEFGLEGCELLDPANVFFASFHYMRNLSYVPRDVYIYCRTCIQLWYPLKCFNPSNCPQEMLKLFREALNERKAVQWKFERDYKRYSVKKLKRGENCAFWSLKCTIADEALMHFQVLAEPFNSYEELTTPRPKDTPPLRF